MSMLRIWIACRCVATVWLLLTATNLASAQRAPAPSRQFHPAVLPELEGVPNWLKEYEFEQEEFTFVRIRYDSVGTRGSHWATDYPDADINLAGQVAKITALNVAAEPQVLRLTEISPEQHPFVYLVEPALMVISEAEVEAFRTYLNGGGFLMIDDFWGERQWDYVEHELARVFPDRTPTELPLKHPLFHCVFDLQEKPQVPSIYVALSGRDKGITWERRDAQVPHYRAIVDNKGRIMVLLCHNTDLGDGWERAGTDAWYTAEFSVKRAFPMGINAIYYALTH
jgi:Domain of unknown function (DUF4159)